MATSYKYLIPKNETREAILKEWAENVITRWGKEMESQGITDAKTLEKTFHKDVINASGGDQARIEFMYLDYLRYLDLGVGRGEKYVKEKHNPTFYSGEKYPTTSGYKWQVKPWFLPILKQRVYSLARILERKYGEYAQLIILKNIDLGQSETSNTNH